MSTENAPDQQPEPADRTPRKAASSGPPYRAIAMVLLTAVVIAVAVGLVQLFGGDDEDSEHTAATATPTSSVAAGTAQSIAPPIAAGQGEPGTEGTSPAPAPAPAPAPVEGETQASAAPAPGAAAAPQSVPVRVYNNSNVSGLAGRTRDELRSSGFDVTEVTNLPSDQGVVPNTVVFYGTGAGEQEAAQAVAAKLGVRAEARPADFRDTTPGVVVVVAQDLQR